MAGRRVDLQPPVNTIGASTTVMLEQRFAVPTGRAKSAMVFVNMLENGGGTLAIDFNFYTTSDPNLDPHLSTSSPFGNWCLATASAPSLSFTAGQGKQTKAIALTILGEQLRYTVTTPASASIRFSIVVYFYDF
jgi:hypothetical protein